MERAAVKQSARYVKIVEWSQDDGCYVGSCPELFLGGCHGTDERAVFAELCEIVDETIDLYHAEGKPLPPATAGRGSEHIAQAGPTPADPVLALRGVGRELWAKEEADAYVSRLREGTPTGNRR